VTVLCAESYGSYAEVVGDTGWRGRSWEL